MFDEELSSIESFIADIPPNVNPYRFGKELFEVRSSILIILFYDGLISGPYVPGSDELVVLLKT